MKKFRFILFWAWPLLLLMLGGMVVYWSSLPFCDYSCNFIDVIVVSFQSWGWPGIILILVGAAVFLYRIIIGWVNIGK
jgi:hypothetical protein